jgi:hypothetical protein
MKVIAIGSNEAGTAKKLDLENLDKRFRSLQNQCAANVPRGSQSPEFFEVFEAPRDLPCELFLWVND